MKFCVLASILVIFSANCSAKRGFLLSAPRILQAGSTEKICLTLHDVDVDVQASISLHSTNSEDEPYRSESEIFRDGNGRCFDFEVPQISNDQVQLSILGSTIDGQYNLNGSREVEIRQDSFLTFIQTDKPMYKPGQMVKFRILSVKPDLKPLLGTISKVWIQDPSSSRIMQWLDVANQDGLASLELQLSKEPVLGEWKISADISGKTQEQTFEVKEYVLPKYEVIIKPPSFLTVDSEVIEGEICAKYTYGEPVEGDLVIDICIPQPSYHWYKQEKQRPCALILETIKGCKKFSVPASDLKLLNSNYRLQYNAKLKVSATVTEKDTGLRQNSTDESCIIVHEKLEINLHDNSPSGFKPGLNYHGKALIQTPDGAPAPNEKIEFSMQNYKSGEVFEKVYESDENGEIHYTIPSFKEIQDSSYSIMAKAIEYQYNNTGVYHAQRMYTPMKSHYIKQWYSPSGSFLQIEPVLETLQCEEEVEVDITYTTEANTNFKFYFEVMSRGNIVHSGHKYHHFKIHDYVEPTEATSVVEDIIVPVQVQPLEDEEGLEPVNEEIIEPENYNPLGNDERKKRSILPYFWVDDRKANITLPGHVSHFKFHFTITPEMAPMSRLLVYYTREDGEVVAGSKQLHVTKCLGNKVEMTFSDEKVRPGESTTLQLKATPNSLCAVGVVDKSVHILKSSNQLTLARVFEQLTGYDIKPGHHWRGRDNYCDKQRKEVLEFPRPRTDPLGPGPVPFEEEALTGVGNGDSETDEILRKKRSIWFPTQSNYYDSLQAFEEEGMIAITDLTLQTRPCTKFIMRPYARGGPEIVDSPIAMTSVDAKPENTNEIPKEAGSAVNLRSYFPETWLWDLERIGEDGEVTLEKKVPHTITEWVGSTFCTNTETGLGVSPVTSLKAFQPFFTSFNLPYSVVRGEKVPVLISVFNYLDDCLAVNLKLKRSLDGGYERLDKQTSVDVCVCGQESTTHKFRVVPKRLGSVNITVSATSIDDPAVCKGKRLSSDTGARDAVIRELLVEAEGLPQEYTYSTFFCPDKDGVDGEFSEKIEFVLPSDVVQDSARGYFTIVGDVMGPTLSNLDNLLHMPYGCGEQNMVNFAPNIFVMQYLTNTNQVNYVIEEKAKEFMRIGYQRELTYKHPDGSYSAFGTRDESGSMWLTAFVVKCFSQAKPFIYIDDKVLQQSTDWFKSHQLENGCFNSVGRVLSKYMKGGLASDSDSPATLTAYVVIAMLEAETDKEDEIIYNAIQCLNIQEVTDPYTASLMAYVYTLYDPESPKRIEYMTLLEELAIEKDGQKHWENPKNTKSSNDYFRPYGTNNPAAVEMTAYALLAYLSSGDENALANALPVMRWLSQQRNAYGGFASTQDTVIALQALAKFASLAYSEGVNIDMAVKTPKSINRFTVSDELRNSLVVYSTPIEDLPTVVEFTAWGTGCALFQANAKYNIQNFTKATPMFNVEVDVLRIPPLPNESCREQRRLKVCAKYQGDDGASNMAVVEVKMVSGWIPNKKSLQILMEDATVNLKRYEIDEQFVNFYFDEYNDAEKCFSFGIEQLIEVEDAKPVTVRIYDYYETEQFAVTKYKVRKICGTKEEIPVLTGEDLEVANKLGLQVRVPPKHPLKTGRVNTKEDLPKLTGEELENALKSGEQVRLPPSFPGVDTAEEFKAEIGEEKCPTCSGVTLPFDELAEEVCKSSHTYKIRMRSKNAHSFPIKVMADLRPKFKVWVGKYVKYEIPSTCECNVITSSKPGTKLFVITHKADLITEKSKKTGLVHLNGETIVLPLDISTERKIRRTIKKGFCDV